MKLKDYVTLGNLLSGFLSIVMIIEGEFDWACYLIYISYVFDVLDGPVARLTKQFDEFGGHFDTVCDYVSYSIAPSFIIYYAYHHIAHFPLIASAFIAAFPITLGTIRQARQSASKKSYPCYWLGLPRPVLTMFIVALLNSGIFKYGFSDTLPELRYAIVALIIIISTFFHLSYIPFVNHHDRKWMGMLKFCFIFFLASSAVAAPVDIIFGIPEIFYDTLLFNMVIMIFVSWTQVPKEDLRRIKHYIATGELILPTCHVSNPIRPKTVGAYFERGLGTPSII